MARANKIVPGPGRNPRAAQVSSVMLRVRLTEVEMAELRLLLAASGKRSMSEMVRMMLLTSKGTTQALEAGDVTVAEVMGVEPHPGQLSIEGT